MSVVYEQKKNILEYLRVDLLSEYVHCHSEIEIIICFSGAVDAYVNAKQYNIRAGDTVIPAL